MTMKRPLASSPNALQTMRANRRVSERERLFRRALWASGLRNFRVRNSLPGRPDIYFPSLRLAVFVDGCFWHSCPQCDLPQPKANAAFWRRKFDENRRRDRAARRALHLMKWRTITVWEHEIRPDPTARAQVMALEVLALLGDDARSTISA
jgi:DNA mismatch endonuclease, patch repair protein